MIPLDKQILEQYIDACELVEEAKRGASQIEKTEKED